MSAINAAIFILAFHFSFILHVRTALLLLYYATGIHHVYVNVSLKRDVAMHLVSIDHLHNARSTEQMCTVRNDGRLESIQTYRTLLIGARVEYHQYLVNKLLAELIAISIRGIYLRICLRLSCHQHTNLNIHPSQYISSLQVSTDMSQRTEKCPILQC